MSKHTPGPWTISKHGNYLSIMDGSGDAVRGPATVCGLYQNRDTTEANARLIAAAPDLLAELKEALIHIRCAAISVSNKPLTKDFPETGEKLVIRGQGDVLRAVAESIEAVIRKAEGDE